MRRKKSHGANVQPQDPRQVYNSTICPGLTMAEWADLMAGAIRYNELLEQNYGTGPVIELKYWKFGAEVSIYYKGKNYIYSTDPMTAKYMVDDEKTRRWYDPHLVLARAQIKAETARLEVKHVDAV